MAEAKRKEAERLLSEAQATSHNAHMVKTCGNACIALFDRAEKAESEVERLKAEQGYDRMAALEAALQAEREKGAELSEMCKLTMTYISQNTSDDYMRNLCLENLKALAAQEKKP